MKTNILLTLAATAAFAILCVSCNQDDAPAKPSIVLTEVGHDNEMTAMRGDDLHLEAEILAEGRIKRIDIEIHGETTGFEIEQSFTSGKYIDVKNVEFHEHIDIPSDAPLGVYHLHFTVTDLEGQTAMADAHINIIEYDEEHHHDE